MRGTAWSTSAQLTCGESQSAPGGVVPVCWCAAVRGMAGVLDGGAGCGGGAVWLRNQSGVVAILEQTNDRVNQILGKTNTPWYGRGIVCGLNFGR